MTVMESKPIESNVVELEGSLIREPDPFPYLMLVAFEASGLIRFALLLLVWPIVRFLGLLGLRDAGFKLAVFIAVVGVRISDIEFVGRAVLPKFYMDHIDMDGWRVFSGYGKKVVASKTPRVMVEWFAKHHLGADQVIASELGVNRFGRATGLLTNVDVVLSQVQTLVSENELVCIPYQFCFKTRCANLFISLNIHPPSLVHLQKQQSQKNQPLPVIFHDGRLVMFPKPAIALLILVWFPIGVIIAIIRFIIALALPICVLPYENLIYGILTKVRGDPPKSLLKSDSSSGVLLVCNHRAFMDPAVIATVLGRKISAVTYSLSRVTEILAPLQTIRLTRDRDVDAKKIEDELKKGDTFICPEGTTCREPFLLRFSALFTELTDRIVPVALNYKPTLFHPTTARGWKGFDPIFFFMNPFCYYEVIFLDQLSVEDTCSGGKSSYDVANDVQRKMAATLGFECTNLTRKDKYMFLKGNDGRV
ncbi:glycerol-3-phosphate acyltransferase 7-like [Silene latifolia]|uniref:glycerol-3-phosphate acyltransferase 7-like n=1 Tax=Silene latifolia TaxID=37657 RepID=UPI003D7703A6